jgi:hypothetical protein
MNNYNFPILIDFVKDLNDLILISSGASLIAEVLLQEFLNE